MEAPAAKKKKIVDSGKKVLICLSDKFIRTDENVICPMIKAENSIRVLYKLQEKLFSDILREVNNETQLISHAFWGGKPTSNGKSEGSVFVELEASQEIDDEKLIQYGEILTQKLRRDTKVKYILTDKVENKEETIPQPIISEADFDLYKLILCYEELFKIYKATEKRADLHIAAENIKSQFEDLKENYTKFAVLSQNGKGKSFILNLLMLLTADNEEEYKENNRNLSLPQVVGDGQTVQTVLEENINLPAVVKDFLKTIENKEQDFRTVIDPVCQLFSNNTCLDVPKKTLSNIGSYFARKKRIDIEPYILAQKEIEESYETTTKCIIHLRYGSVYQMSVNYFDAEELQEQLFELFTLNEEDTSNQTSHLNEDVKDRAQDCLKARLQNLTDYDIGEDLKKIKNNIISPKDIVLSEEVKMFAGKTELYLGQGKQSTDDRLALQTVLRSLTTTIEEDENKKREFQKRISAVKQIVVYLPSKILYGGKEILEMPGTDDSDPIAMTFIENALNEVDAVILMSDFAFKIVEKEVKDMLFHSGFVKKWRKDPTNYKLILLAYPEKNLRWQFGKDDKDKIKKLEQEERKKRHEELKIISKMLKEEPLPEMLERNITTSYILPVLHTSVLAQKGTEHVVVKAHEDFLKYTGIENVITETDKYVSSRQKSSIEEVKTRLSHFLQEINGEMNAEGAKSIMHLLSNKEFANTIKPQHKQRNEQDLGKLRKELKKMLTDIVDNEVEKILIQNLQQAQINWNENKEKITKIGVFNPCFYGKHPTYKVRLYNVIFNDMEAPKLQIFQLIRQNIEKILENYKINEIEQCKKELNHLLSDMDEQTVSADFIQKTIEHFLDDTIKWYMGRKKRPFNEKTMAKHFQESEKQSLKKRILEPNFKKDNLETAKIVTELNIRPCVMEVKTFFIGKLFALHEDRWKSFNGKFYEKNGQSKIWKLIFARIKLLSKQRDSKENKEGISNLITMMSANLN